MTRRHDKFTWILLGSLLIPCLPASKIFADVAPPVSISLAKTASAATHGEPYEGVFEVHIYQAGEVSGMQIDGEGW
ncbi:MAG: hypothetical protein ACYTHJ_00615 [Planctomycetota bacterium]